MDQTEAHKIARAMMDENGLKHWKIEFNRNKSRLGMCSYGLHTLFFSAEFLDYGTFLDTVKHEMAHAIVGPKVAPHGAEWKAAVTRLGGKAQATTKIKSEPEFFKYYGVCPCGKAKKGFHRKPGSFAYTCRTCNGALSWTMDGKPMQTLTRTEFIPAFAAERVSKPRTRAVKTGRGHGAFDRGFTDIESLWND